MMQTLIWAVGSMLVLLLIISILPLGFSIKGKVLIVLAGFVLALAGHGAMTTFSLWLTGFMLVGLVFFTAYMMDSRMGAFLYKEKLSLADDKIDENESSNQDVRLRNNNLLLDTAKTEVGLPSIENLPVNSNTKSVPKRSDVTQEKENRTKIMDDEISFLMDRNVETEKIEDHVDSEYEIGYLSDIESLLVDEFVEKAENSEAGWLKKTEEFSITNLEETLSDQNGVEEELHLDELFFDHDLAAKEAAVGKDLDEKKSQPKLDSKVILK
jgi:hypothetical protein